MLLNKEVSKIIVCGVLFASVIVFKYADFTYASCAGSSCDKSCSNARYSTKNLGCFTSGLAGGKCETSTESCGSCKCKPDSLVQDSSCSCKS